MHSLINNQLSEMNAFLTSTHKVTMSSSIMHFDCDDDALLLYKFELEDFSKNRSETEYLNHL